MRRIIAREKVKDVLLMRTVAVAADLFARITYALRSEYGVCVILRLRMGRGRNAVIYAQYRETRNQHN